MILRNVCDTLHLSLVYQQVKFFVIIMGRGWRVLQPRYLLTPSSTPAVKNMISFSYVYFINNVFFLESIVPIL